MGNLDPKSLEMDILARMQLEAASQYGTEVKIKFVKSIELDNQHDPIYEFSLPEELPIILQERPQKKILRELNWFNEDDEIMPLLAYISRLNSLDLEMDILMGTQIELPYVIHGVVNTKIYEISDVKTIPPNNLMWVCKLVPVRDVFDNKTEDNENQDNNFDVLHVDKNDNFLNL